MIEKYLQDNNLEVEEVIYMDDEGQQIWQLSPSGGLLLHNDEIITYLPQSYLDNWNKTYPFILDCYRYNKD